MPKLAPAPVLVNITNTGRWEYPPPNKAEKLDDLSEPSAADIEEKYGIESEDGKLYRATGNWKIETRTRQRG